MIFCKQFDIAKVVTDEDTVNSGESISLTRPYKNQHHAIWKLLYVHTNMLYLQKSTSKIDWLFFINYCTWLHFILPQKYYVDV